MTASNLSQRISKRLSPESLREVRKGQRHNLEPCKKLRFFMQYSESVASKLLDVATFMPNVDKNTLLFKQGDHLDGYYVIVRGTVKIEQKAAKYMNRPDMPPIVIRTCYDGDYFGEMISFTTSIIGKKPPPKNEEDFIK